MTDTQNLLLSAANDVAKVQVEAIKQAVIAEMGFVAQLQVSNAAGIGQCTDLGTPQTPRMNTAVSWQFLRRGGWGKGR